MKTKLQENDAPKGYVAVEILPDYDHKLDICTGCAFVGDSQCGKDRPCCSGDRKDKRNVIFVKAPAVK